ncbi:MAG: hypothetical protein BWY74_02900 [Firmicutes bacterium ADurb.Bin419]|nr:MAG: hypothetical protein BWY74_02900 [Firmicutes bacterium ADurb.Bin419]
MAVYQVVEVQVTMILVARTRTSGLRTNLWQTKLIIWRYATIIIPIRII